MIKKSSEAAAAAGRYLSPRMTLVAVIAGAIALLVRRCARRYLDEVVCVDRQRDEHWRLSDGAVDISRCTTAAAVRAPDCCMTMALHSFVFVLSVSAATA